jgi:tetratricopeptide (TPR) repeat protein
MTLGEEYLALEDDVRAKAAFERALEENPKLGVAREHLADLALKAKDPESVIRLLEPVYAQIKDRYEVLAPLGEAYFRRGDNERAIDLLERAIVLKRPSPAVLNVLANAQYKAGNLTRSLELLDRSLATDPNQPEVKELRDRLKGESGG